MTPSQKKRAVIEAKAGSLGWTKDRWGHWKKDIDGTQCRLKMQKTSVRFEKKINSGWFNVASDYFKNFQVIPEGIKIMGRLVI